MGAAEHPEPGSVKEELTTPNSKKREPSPSHPEIPDIRDQSAARPQVNQHTLSPAAIASRAKRIFTPRANGTLKVSKQIFEEWKKRGSKERKNLEQIFKACGYSPDGDSDCFVLLQLHRVWLDRGAA